MGSLGARCFAVIREIHYHADAASAPAAEMPSDGPAARPLTRFPFLWILLGFRS